ncbi:hypothetical protein PR048_029028 [Dryococelus australis]|uniref:Uncharacterized protein n=1 Tax=Dryococelus australis TaxID=614101 RepID=A0ABQ9GCT3_9NEOP|nr:hypothetical protein PR048_029028 [Dryococelus australis]
MSFGSRGDVVVRLLASHLCEQSSIPGGAASVIFACVSLAGRCRWSVGFLVYLPFPPPLHSSAASYSSHLASSTSGPRSVLAEKQFNVVDTENGRAQSARSVCLIFSLWLAHGGREAGRCPLQVCPPSVLRRRTAKPTACQFPVLRADEDEARWIWISAGMEGRGKREIPEKTRRPAASTGMIPICLFLEFFTAINIFRCSGITGSDDPTRDRRSFGGDQQYFSPFGATVVERLACSPPTKATRVQSPAGPLRIFACGNRAGRCRWSAGFLGDPPFPPALSFRRCPIFISITLIGSQDLDVKSRPNLFTHSLLTVTSVKVWSWFVYAKYR